MSGECGYNSSKFGTNNEGIARAAATTLGRLNSMIKQMSDWREERFALKSNVQRLKSALKKFGKNPDEALGPDPLLVHQRSEINRLELTKERLEDDVRSLRTALREADQAITCSGAKRLKDKMTKMREDGADEVRKLKNEIGHLKLRVQEAENDSSCSSLGRLRIKLREILNGDKKMERVIADVASRSCETLIDLSNELTRIKELLDESNLQNIRVNGENGRLKSALDSEPKFGMVSGSSGYLETIERLRLRVKELERKIKEVEDDSGLVKRVGELENALNKNRKELEEREVLTMSLKNELVGAKTAYKIKSEELERFKDSKHEVQELKKTLKNRDELVEDLKRQIKLSITNAEEIERVKNGTEKMKEKILNFEIERDGLLDEIEKLGVIVSERNEHIVKILEENEAREKTRESEIEGARKTLCIISGENGRLKLRCENLEEELSKLNETGKASGDRKKIKELEEELAELEEFKKKSIVSKLRVEKEAENLSAKFIDRLNKLKTENTTLKNEIDELEAKNLRLLDKLQSNKKLTIDVGIQNEKSEPEKQEIQIEDNFEKKLSKLEADKFASKSELEEIKTERDRLKREFRKLNSANNELNIEIEKSKKKIDELAVENEEMKSYEGLKERLENLEEDLDKSLKDSNLLRRRLKVEKDDRESLEKLLSEFEEEKSKSFRIKKLTQDTKTDIETLVTNSGDYIRADRELKYYIHLQSLAVKRVVDFISYVDGTNSVKPAMATFLEPTTSNLMVLNFDENLTATFRMSQKLSEKIFKAEINVQKLEALRNERNNLKIERDCLNKGIENLSKILSLNVTSWEATSPASEEENYVFENPRVDEEEKFLLINKRISVLQEQINFKQDEAAKKLIEMRETMRQERIRLMEIADRENVPFSEKNFQL